VLDHWNTTIGDLDYADALAAVNMHFRESTDYLMPAHIRAGARRIREDRARRQIDGTDHGEAAPVPKNLEAWSAAWNDPIEFAKQKAIYNQQLIDEGFTPLYTEPAR